MLSAIAANDTTIHLKLEKLIPGNYSSFYIDNLGNVFLINKTNQVKKLDQNFDSVSVFNDVRRYGDIHSLDVNNPLKILVYYSDFTTILTLDRFLNVLNTIDLRKSNILQAKVVAQSYDNNYWVFDELDNTIKKIDDNGNIIFQFADFRILFADSYNPSHIVDEDGLLYLYDYKNGCLIFDYYGALKQKVTWLDKEDIQVASGNLSGRDSMYFYSINIKSFTETRMHPDISLSDAMKVQHSANKLLVLKKDGLSVYDINK